MIKRAALLQDEEPPISFYADLVEQGTVKVEYNQKGGLVVTQGTQYDKEMLKKEPWLFPMLSKTVLVMCGLVTIYTVQRIALEPIQCTCGNCGKCVSLGMHLFRSLKRLWYKQ